jgi:hypothetical protein
MTASYGHSLLRLTQRRLLCEEGNITAISVLPELLDLQGCASLVNQSLLRTEMTTGGHKTVASQ